ncbi:uncharacterized protein J3R85_004846 [Psidium guajava]|nr:uncharacterized protein J3R85_004846 [Psidium guajava]
MCPSALGSGMGPTTGSLSKAGFFWDSIISLNISASAFISALTSVSTPFTSRSDCDLSLGLEIPHRSQDLAYSDYYFSCVISMSPSPSLVWHQNPHLHHLHSGYHEIHYISTCFSYRFVFCYFFSHCFSAY